MLGFITCADWIDPPNLPSQEGQEGIVAGTVALVGATAMSKNKTKKAKLALDIKFSCILIKSTYHSYWQVYI